MRPVDDLPYVEWEPDSGGTTRLYADAWRRESISAPAMVTEHAVESGSIVSDHFLLLPVTAKITLFFSGSPVRGDLDPAVRGEPRQVALNIPAYPEGPPIYSPRGLVSGIKGALGIGGAAPLPKSFTALAWDVNPSRLRPAFEQIMKLREDRKLVVVNASVARIPDCAMKEIRIARSEDDGDSGEIEIDLIQFRFVKSDVAIALPLPLEPRGQKKTGANSAAGTKPVEGEQTSAAVALGKTLGLLQ
jgi:hypothetical protein